MQVDPSTFLVNRWLPVAHSGPWSISRFVQDGAEHTVLRHGHVWWMDDLPGEFADTREFLQSASGNVLLLGLGLGAVPAWLMRHAPVYDIVIIENDPQVIGLVYPHLRNLARELRKNLIVIQDDAKTFRPQRRYDHVWLDIWVDSSIPEFKPEIEAMVSHYAQYSDRQWVWYPQGRKG